MAVQSNPCILYVDNRPTSLSLSFSLSLVLNAFAQMHYRLSYRGNGFRNKSLQQLYMHIYKPMLKEIISQIDKYLIS